MFYAIPMTEREKLLNPLAGAFTLLCGLALFIAALSLLCYVLGLDFEGFKFPWAL